MFARLTNDNNPLFFVKCIIGVFIRVRELHSHTRGVIEENLLN